VLALQCRALFRGDEARAWLLHAVRNAAYVRLESRRSGAEPAPDSDGAGMNGGDSDRAPSAALATSRASESLEAAAAALPIHLLECLILREIEQLKYKEIARITEVPVETVMSRLHRARRLLTALTADASESVTMPSA
jgi:RNA polymerase sigma-70 factor (ECF subfamily)